MGGNFLAFLFGRYLAGGGYTLSGSGGADVGPFEINLLAPDELVWLNRSELAAIDRTEELIVEWVAPDEQATGVLVAGGAYDAIHDASAVFVCHAPPGAESFRVPQRVLATLPASRAQAFRSTGFLYVGAIAGPNPVAIEGLDAAVEQSISGQGRTVIWK